MKQLKLVQVGNPLFRKTCTRFSDADIVSGATKQIVDQMMYTMRKIHGVGLAAPQIGLQKQLFVLRLQPTKYRPHIKIVKPYTVFNPQILSNGVQTNTDWEGCFSVAKAGLFAEVTRPQSIKVKYQNARAEIIERTIEGLEARVFQHEYDHLQGQVFLNRPHEPATYMSADEYKAMRARQAG